MGTKSILSSVTFWGAVISVIAGVFPVVFVYAGLDPVTGGAEMAAKIVSVIGFVTAVYGRIRARNVVTVTGEVPADGKVSLKK